MRSVPGAAEGMLRLAEQGGRSPRTEGRDLVRASQSLGLIGNRLAGGVILAGMIIGSALAMNVTPAGA